MVNDSSGILGLVIFGTLILSSLIESVLSGTWNKIYFITGLPIFIMRIPVRLRHSNIPSPSQFETRFHSSLVSSLVFHELELNTYGFREKFIEFRFIGYSPLMRGVLFFDFKNNEVVIKGFVNWSILYFSLIWLGGISVAAVQNRAPLIALMFTLFFALVIGLLYWIQHYRFSNVATFAAQAWSRKYLRDGVRA